MSGSVVTTGANILPTPPSQTEGTIVRLQEAILPGRNMPFRVGLLQNVIEPDGESIVLANIDNILVEAPKSQAAKLQQLVGRTVCLAIVDGKFRVGALA
jgi:hypothetical protein